MQDIPLSSEHVKRHIRQIRECIRALYIESCKSGIPTQPTVEALLSVYPQQMQGLCRLAEAGISWSYLIRYSDLNNIKFRLSDMSTKPPTKSSKLEERLYFLVAKIKNLFDEMKKYGDTIPYLSKDVFCTIHTDAGPMLDSLERKQITWTNLLKLAGLPVEELFTSDNKRQAALTSKAFLESNGITVKHLIFLQKLILFTRADNPGGVDKLVKDTFGVDIVNDRFYTYMLSRISEVVNYLNSIS